LLASGDTRSVKRLLAARCPDSIWVVPLEFEMAMVRGPSGVALLVAAYPSAGTNYSAQVLVGCLARAFPSLRAKTETDTDFVAACGRWLAENKARCVVNPTYMYAHAIGAPVVPKE